MEYLYVFLSRELIEKGGCMLKTMRSTFLTLFLFLCIPLIMGLFPSSTKACDCAVPKTATEALERASAVFTGKVLQIKQKNMNKEQYDVVTLEVERVWKGIDQTQIVVYTQWSSCQFKFEKGEEYLLYAYRSGDHLMVINCGRSAQLAAATQDLNELGIGQVPSQRVNVNGQSELGGKPILSLIYLVLAFTIISLVIGLVLRNKWRRK